MVIIIKDLTLLMAPQNLKKDFHLCIVVVGRLFVLGF